MNTSASVAGEQRYPIRVARWFRGVISAIATGAILSACSILPKSDPATTYRLPTTPAETRATPAAPIDRGLTLRVYRPQASGALAGQQLLVYPRANEVAIYKGARWTDTPPAMVREALVDALMRHTAVPIITTDERGIRSDYELDSDLRSFQSEYRGTVPNAVVVLDARLVRTSDQRVVASRRFEYIRQAQGTETPMVVDALGMATVELARELSRWTSETLRAQPIDPLRRAMATN